MSTELAFRALQQHRRILLTQVRRNWPCCAKSIDKRPTPVCLHTEAGVAAAGMKAGGAHDHQSAAIVLAVGGMMALGSLVTHKNEPEVKVVESHKPEEEEQGQSREQQKTEPLVTADATTGKTTATVATGTATATGAPLGPLLSTACEPRRTTTKPRNAMVISRKSMRGRGLYDKYKVDWDTVLGEGAYGTVHPARLAATGEKVTFLKTFA